MTKGVKVDKEIAITYQRNIKSDMFKPQIMSLIQPIKRSHRHHKNIYELIKSLLSKNHVLDRDLV